MNISKLCKSAAASLLVVALTCPAFAGTETLARGVVPQQTFGKASEISRNINPAIVAKSVRGGVLRQSRPVSQPLYQPASMRVADKSGLPAIYGSVIAANSWQSTDKVGIYRLPTSEGGKFEMIAAGPDANYGGVLAGDTYYCTSSMSKFGMEFVKVASYDAATWESKANRTASVSNKATDLAYDPESGKVYGCFQKEYGSGSNLATMNLSTLGIDVIQSTDDNWCAFAIDTDGTLYGIVKEVSVNGSTAVTTSSSLYKINKLTGAKTLVGETGCLPYYLSSACIDSRSGRMFWAVSAADETSALYEVDKQTGRASLICNFPDGEEVTGLFTIAPEADDKAPAAVSGLVVSFPEGNLTGTVSFDAPSTLFSGVQATGTLSYRVMNGTTQLAAGTTSYGAHVDVPVAVSKAGIYELSVIVSNESGDSPAATVSLFIGNGTPSAPVVTASYDGSSFTVNWTPVTEASDGGYLNPEDVTYKVVRYPAGVVVETATKATSVINQVDEPDAITKYWYGVTASYSGRQGKEALSNTVFLGSLNPPFTQSFMEESGVETYQIINANGDDRTWEYYNGAVRVHYNKTLPMDDWLISPAVNLEKGKSYRFVIKVKAQSSSYTEAIEVKLGTSATVAGMTGTIIGRTEIRNTAFEELDGFIVPAVSGRHYIGIHACSEANSYDLYVEGFNVESPTSAAAPSAPAEIKTVPDPDGALRTTIYITAPSTDFNNEPLESLSHLELSRDGNLIKTFRPINPGETVSFADETSGGGNHIYTAAAYNEFGRGDERSVQAFVGINIPAAPAKADIVETENDGEVTVSWPVVNTDFAGNPLNPELVSYTIWQLKAETHVVLYDNIKTTSHTFRAVTPPDQTFVHYFVSAETDGGISPLTETPLIPCGQPYSLPFEEKFRNGDTESIMAIGDEGNALWSLMQDNNNLGITSRDGDNGFLLSRGRVASDFASVNTAKVKIDGVENPGVSFYTYNVNIDNTPDRNIIEIQVDDGSGFKTIKSAEVCSLGDNPGWVMMSASLADYVGKTVLVGFKTTVVNYFETIIDDIRIASLTDYDVAVTECHAPSSAPFNKPFSVQAKIENLGILAAKDFNVNLVGDGEKVATRTVSNLAPGEYVNVSFEPVFTALQKNAVQYMVEIDFLSDEVMANNRSEIMSVTPDIPTLPIAKSLKAVKTGNNVVLSWERPDIEGYEPVSVTEDFEDCESFTTGSFGGWTTYDGDKASIGTISDVQIPNIAYGSQQSWWVMDADYEKFNKSFHSHSGRRYLAQMYAIAADGTAYQCDDWLISPRLTGKEQTVSFYARSYSSTYPESFEIMVSSTGNDISDFTMLDNRSGIMSDWTLYSFTLPEGTEYFAIRCVSLNKFMMFVDDITCIPASASELDITGYNIWRDNSLVGTVPSSALSFSEEMPENQDPVYVVTTVYDKGESAPTEEVHLIAAGASSIVGAELMIGSEPGFVTVSGAEGLNVTVVAPDGRIVADEPGAGLNRISVTRGIYIVVVGQTTAKVVVE